MKTIIHWFTNDLRLHDMPAFQALHNADALLPVFVFDTRNDEATQYGFPRMGAQRKAFIEQSVSALKNELQNKGSDLLVLKGIPEKILPQLARIHDAQTIHVEQPIASEELGIINAIENDLGKAIHCFESRTIFLQDALPFDLQSLPNIFTEFRKLIEKHIGYEVQTCADVNLPPLPPGIHEDLPFETYRISSKEGGAHPRAAFRAIGGEFEGLRRLQHYTFETHAIATYKETRNGLIGDAYSSKFSPWLATGCLSVKKILETINHYESMCQSNDSTYWMKFELLWREFFQWTLKKHGNDFFRLSGIRGNQPNIHHDQQLIDDWRFGETSDKFVNANMKELLHTGFMSNRGRQNVASYFVHNLKQDWRIGAAWFESQLIDYDVASNWGNWMYVAGVGNDPRQDRVFNTKKQAEMYDSKGEYQSLWLS